MNQRQNPHAQIGRAREAVREAPVVVSKKKTVLRPTKKNASYTFPLHIQRLVDYAEQLREVHKDEIMKIKLKERFLPEDQQTQFIYERRPFKPDVDIKRGSTLPNKPIKVVDEIDGATDNELFELMNPDTNFFG